MEIGSYLTDEAVLAELGRRLERVRLERNLTQRELAAQAGVERKVLQRIEAGEQARLTSFIRVLRALDLLDALERLVPEPSPSPMELLRLHGRQRRRASGRRGHGARSPQSPATESGDTAPQQPRTAPWRWGDEAPGEER